ncbi:transketolase [Serratia odorifera]|nr:transketolase [Serratia odorifera]MBJ2064732.1 transketolase [Serratia odorifera]PNK92853.1 transketolase [Serratia odorifera]RII70982.1 transketolase [Serratia odorifera]VDZ62804.1 Transketolase 2 [Serratia odorifera]HEJ9093830.1 transketolase [Serratia odorifera]
MDFQAIKNTARQARRYVVTMNHKAGKGHTGADLSEIDIICTLYMAVMDRSQARPDQDRFILSKGHGAGGFYCSCAAMGLLDPAVLDQFMGDDTLLAGHPVHQKLPELIEINSGGLGHGLPIAVGLALGNKLAGRAHRRAFVLLGDGELAEGSNWEAAMAASKFKLDNLIAIVDRNRLQLAGKTEAIMPLEPLAEKWRAFGFEVIECDGHDPASLVEAMTRAGQDQPRVILANTEKGHGVSFMANVAAWHHAVPDDQQLAQALAELEN